MLGATGVPRFNGGISGKRRKQGRHEPNGIILLHAAATSAKPSATKGSSTRVERVTALESEDEGDWCDESFMLSSFSETSELSDSEWSEWEDPLWVEDPHLLHKSQQQRRQQQSGDVDKKNQPRGATTKGDATDDDEEDDEGVWEEDEEEEGEGASKSGLVKDKSQGVPDKAKTKTKAKAKTKTKAKTAKAKSSKGKAEETKAPKKKAKTPRKSVASPSPTAAAAAVPEPTTIEGGGGDGLSSSGSEDGSRDRDRDATIAKKNKKSESDGDKSECDGARGLVVSPRQADAKRMSVMQARDVWEARTSVSLATSPSPTAKMSQSDRTAVHTRLQVSDQLLPTAADVRRSHNAVVLERRAHDRYADDDDDAGTAAAKRKTLTVAMLPVTMVMPPAATAAKEKDKRKKEKEIKEKESSKDKNKERRERQKEKKESNELKKKKSRSMDVIEELKKKHEVISHVRALKLERVKSSEDDGLVSSAGAEAGASDDSDDKYFSFLRGTANSGGRGLSRSSRSFVEPPLSDRQRRSQALIGRASAAELTAAGDSDGTKPGAASGKLQVSMSVREIPREKREKKGFLSSFLGGGGGGSGSSDKQPSTKNSS